MHIYIHTSIIYWYVYIYIYMYIHIHIYTRMYTDIYTYKHVYTCSAGWDTIRNDVHLLRSRLKSDGRQFLEVCCSAVQFSWNIWPFVLNIVHFGWNLGFFWCNEGFCFGMTYRALLMRYSGVLIKPWAFFWWNLGLLLMNYWVLLTECRALFMKYGAVFDEVLGSLVIYNITKYWKYIEKNPLSVSLCKTLHDTATHCNTLQHTRLSLRHTATHCNSLQHTAPHCTTL